MEKHQPVLQCKDVSKIIGNKRIVNKINLELYPGEIFGFLGPNGAGKTTMIRMLVGLISMTEGQILIKGADVTTDFEQAVAHVGAIIENPELYTDLTGYQNIIHFARMSGSISKAQIDQIVHWVGLKQTIQDKVKTYSLGMRQRLGLAQALIHSPSLLILDEPTNGLDPVGIQNLRKSLLELAKKRGMSVFVSSHQLAEMELMCNRIGVIDNGELIDVRSVEEFVKDTDDRQVTFIVDLVATARQKVQELFPEQFVKSTDQSIDLRLHEEQIPQVAKCLVDNGVKLYQIQTTTYTLEDQFIQVTGGEQHL